MEMPALQARITFPSAWILSRFWFQILTSVNKGRPIVNRHVKTQLAVTFVNATVASYLTEMFAKVLYGLFLTPEYFIDTYISLYLFSK